MKELITIQQKLNCPKTLFNKFGNYHYRNCEGIFEAVKPLLKETNCTLTVRDELVDMGGRLFIKATATLVDSAGNTINNTGYAEIETGKKGMDASQITGAASSYARKYALNGLFLIDDVKDADSDEYTSAVKKKEQQWDDDIENTIMCCNSKEELSMLWKNHPDITEKYAKIFTKRKNQLEGR